MIHAIHLTAGRWRKAMRVLALVLAGAAALLAGSPAGAQTRAPADCDGAPQSASREGPRAPNLIGSTFQQAALDLRRRYQIRPRRIEVPSAEPHGQVVDQWPESDDPIVNGFVLLCVSNGQGVRTIVMPDLFRQPLEGSLQALRGLGFRATPNIQRVESLEPQGVIFGQMPEPGTRVSAAAPIVLEVSTGPPIPMPDLVGQPLDRGRQMLRVLRIGRDPAIHPAEHAEARDVIYGQLPPAGTRVTASTPIRLDVSTGPPILMPDLVGRPLDQGREMLRALGFERDVEVRREQHEERRDRIYDQSPEPRTRLDAASDIVLYVSDGPSPSQTPQLVPIPDLQGRGEAEAIALLQGAGLVAVQSGSEESESFAEGLVIWSSPAAGERVPRGSQVHYVLSLGPPRGNPILRWLEDNLARLLAFFGGSLAGALAVKVLMPRRPRFSLALAGPPRSRADWGQPPEPAFDLRFDPPRASLRIRPAEPDEEGA